MIRIRLIAANEWIDFIVLSSTAVIGLVAPFA
jgi:hypothetical protein